MNCQTIVKNGKKYIRFTNAADMLQNEQGALDMISACASGGTNLAMLDGEALSDEFVRLRTGLAGAALQKFTNYNIRVAVFVDKDYNFNKRFEEMIYEYNKGGVFRVFMNHTEAESWLLG